MRVLVGEVRRFRSPRLSWIRHVLKIDRCSGEDPLDNEEKVDVLGVKVDPKNLEAVLQRVEEFIRRRDPKTIMYANVHCVNIACKDAGFREILNRSDLVYCDGYGIVIGARILGEFIPERMTGADWIHDLASLCREKGYSLFLLGGRPGVAEQAGGRLRSLYEGIEIKGVHHGYLVDEEMVRGVLHLVNEARPDILLVGIDAPTQGSFVARYREPIDVPVCWVVGALFHFVSRIMPRTTRRILDHWIDWSYRLIY